MSKKIGIYGGTFDPIHFGHMNLAFELGERCALDEVWFIPAQINPHKVDKVPPSLANHRLKMLHLALDLISQFQVKDLELLRSSPSYTIETIRALIEEAEGHPRPDRFFLLLGEDALPSFCRWHLAEEIVKLVPLLIGSRSGSWQYDPEKQDPLIREAIHKGLVKTRMMDISGTEIRKRLERKAYCGHLVPAPVLDYIHQNALY